MMFDWIEFVIYNLGPLSIIIVPIVSTLLYRKNHKVLIDSYAVFGEVVNSLSPVVFFLIMIVANSPILIACYLCFWDEMLSFGILVLIVAIDLGIMLKLATSLYKKNIFSRFKENMNSGGQARCMSVELFLWRVLIAEIIDVIIFILFCFAWGAGVLMSV